LIEYGRNQEIYLKTNKKMINTNKNIV